MRGFRLAIVFGTLLVAVQLWAQPPGILRGTVKKLDVKGAKITLTHEGKDSEYTITEQTRVFGAEDRPFAERLKTLSAGAEVQFLPGTGEGKAALVGIRPAQAFSRNGVPLQRQPYDASKLVPLTEMGSEKYQGFEGGLYPDGKNERPAQHEAAGLKLAQQVQPLDADGKPSPQGRIVLLSVGMSNTSQSSEGFARWLDDEPDRNPQVVFLNGAQGGMTARAIQNPSDNASGTRFWTEVDRRIASQGLSRAQVQAVWIKQADAGPSSGFPAYAKTLQEELGRIARVLVERFPNARLAYLSSRTYGGYARTGLNPEPYAFESGYSVKWLIEQQIDGDAELNFDAAKGAVKSPWLSWGPYLWAAGERKRSDGFFYLESDFSEDGTHQSRTGQQKVGYELLKFFRGDSTTRPWFVGRE